MKSRRKIPATPAPFTDGRAPNPNTMAVDARPSAGDMPPIVRVSLDRGRTRSAPGIVEQDGSLTFDLNPKAKP